MTNFPDIGDRVQHFKGDKYIVVGLVNSAKYDCAENDGIDCSVMIGKNIKSVSALCTKPIKKGDKVVVYMRDYAELFYAQPEHRFTEAIARPRFRKIN